MGKQSDQHRQEMDQRREQYLEERREASREADRQSGEERREASREAVREASHEADRQNREDAIASRTREQRLRRAAERQGLRLVKCRLRDPWAVGYGLWGLVEPATGGTINPLGPTGQPTWTLDDVEDYLRGDR